MRYIFICFFLFLFSFNSSAQPEKEETIKGQLIQSCSLKEGPSIISKTIVQLKKGANVLIYEYEDPFFKVSLKNYTGYIFVSNIINTKELDLFKNRWDQIKTQNEKLITFNRHVNKGAELFNQGSYKQSLEEYMKAKNILPNNAEIVDQITRLENKIDSLDFEELKRKEENIKIAQLVKQRQLDLKKEKLIREYGELNGTKIFNNTIWIGMTEDMAVKSIGFPQKVNRTVLTREIHEQWVYSNKYLYFQDGILTSWQD